MSSSLKRFFFALSLAAALAGCSSSPAPTGESKPASAPKVPENQTEAGREALQKMYASARVWSPDSQPVSLTSVPRKGDSVGKAAVWSASFASAAKHSIRNFMWSGAGGEDAPESGISLGSIDTYSPDNQSTRPFDMNFLKVDSTDAFEVAQKHGGEALLKKTPDMLTKYQLQWDPRASKLFWSIQYDPRGSQYKLDVLVNASTGWFVRVEK